MAKSWSTTITVRGNSRVTLPSVRTVLYFGTPMVVYAVAVADNSFSGWVHFMIHRPEPHILIFRREREQPAPTAPAAAPAAIDV